MTGYTLSQGLRNIIYKTTLEAKKYSYGINYLSSGHLQVTNKFLTNSISLLGHHLLLMESPQEIQAAQLILTNNCKNTVQGIKMLIQDHAKAFKQRVFDRMNAIKLEYDAGLPPISIEDQNEIQNMIKQATKSAPEETVAEGV